MGEMLVGWREYAVKAESGGIFSEVVLILNTL